MWLIKAGTQIQVCAPFGKVGGAVSEVEKGVWFTDLSPWKPYVTSEDKLYDSEEVWDMVAVYNGRDDVPRWAKHNIELSKGAAVILHRDGKFAMVDRELIEYLD